MKKYVGIFGYGAIGTKYAHWLTQMNCEVGVFDLDTRRISNKQTRNFKLFSSAEKLAHWAKDCSIISTPPDNHLSTLNVILKNSKSSIVLIEKPLSSSLEDGRKILELSRKNKSRLFGVCNLRFHPGVQTLKNELKRIGKVYFTKAYFSHRLSQMRASGLSVFAAEDEYGGGVVLDCVHDIDIFIWLFGKSRVLHSWSGQLGNEKIKAEDYAAIFMETEHGIRGSFHFDFIGKYKQRGFEIVGEFGSLSWKSEGKNPEIASVFFCENDKKISLLKCENLDASLAYKEMLQKALSDAKDLQTIDEAFNVLSLASDASGSVLKN